MNALKIKMFDFLCEIIFSFEMLEECPAALVNKTH